jgi:hypothetical protein
MERGRDPVKRYPESLIFVIMVVPFSQVIPVHEQ